MRDHKESLQYESLRNAAKKDKELIKMLEAEERWEGTLAALRLEINNHLNHTPSRCRCEFCVDMNIQCMCLACRAYPLKLLTILKK